MVFIPGGYVAAGDHVKMLGGLKCFIRLFQKIKLLNLIQYIINVMQPLDGKVYNVRIKDAISNVSNDSPLRCYVNDSFNRDYIHVYSRDEYNKCCDINVVYYVPEGGTAKVQ